MRNPRYRKQRPPQVAQTDDRQRPIAVNTQDVSQRADELVDSVTDPRMTELAEKREVLADLCIFDGKGFPELAARDGCKPLPLIAFELSEVEADSPHDGLGGHLHSRWLALWLAHLRVSTAEKRCSDHPKHAAGNDGHIHPMTLRNSNDRRLTWSRSLSVGEAGLFAPKLRDSTTKPEVAANLGELDPAQTESRRASAHDRDRVPACGHGRLPRSTGAMKMSIASTCPWSKNEPRTWPPPSTKRLVMPRRPSSSRSGTIGTCAFPENLTIRTPDWPVGRLESGSARLVTATSTGTSRAERARRLLSGSRAALSRMIRAGRRGGSAIRAVSCGSSASTVPIPATIPSIRPLSSWTRCLDGSDEIHRLSPEAVAALPSKVIAHLAVTKGNRVHSRLRYGAFSSRAGSAWQPTSTEIPAASSAASPRPLTSGKGSAIAATTRVIPAAMTAVVHGGVLPKWQHGSSVT